MSKCGGNRRNAVVNRSWPRSGITLGQIWTVLRSGRWLEAGQYNGNYGRMERIYLLADPWNLSSPRETARFELINALIARLVPGCETLLEIGSGEGVHTARLLEVSQQVTGLEVSSTAVERARARVSAGEFIIGCAEEASTLLTARRFDLVTACEVLYYARDVEGILANLSSLAPMILVINYERRARLLAHHFEGPGWTRLDNLSSHGMDWWCHLWRAPVATQLADNRPVG